MRDAARGELGPDDDRALLAIAGLKLGFHLLTARGHGIFRDELYYLACAAHPDWGYVDHPPLSIWLLWLETALFGDSLFAIRLVPALAGAASVFIAGRVARELGGGRAAQRLAALATFGVPFLLAISHFYSMNVLEWLLWSVLAWLAARALRRGDGSGWLAFGAVAGLALLNKLQIVAWAGGLVLGLAATRERHHLARPGLWLGGALAALLFAPHLLWQLHRGWPTLEFIANASTGKIYHASPFEFFSGQIVLLGPWNAPVWLLGLGALLFAPAFARFRALGLAWLVSFTVFAAQGAKVYYLAAAYPPLLAAGAAALEHFVPRRGALVAAGGVLALGAVAGALLAVPVLPPEQIVAWTRRIGISEPRTENREHGELPPTFADMHGWHELVDTVAGVWEALPEAERGRAAILASNYGEAGAVDRMGRARGLPPAISGHNNYWLWGPGSFDGSVAVVVGMPREELEEWFEEVEEVAVVRCRWCQPVQNGRPVYVVRRLRGSVEAFWSQLKRYA
jgi:hypothetical protein